MQRNDNVNFHIDGDSKQTPPAQELAISMPGYGPSPIFQAQVPAPVIQAPPVILDPNAEGFNHDAYIKHLDSLFEVYIKNRDKQAKEQDLTLFHQREAALRKEAFKQNHERIYNAASSLWSVAEFRTEASLIWNVLVGGTLIDKAKKNNFKSQDDAYYTLLQVYIASQLLRSGLNSISTTSLKYLGAKRVVKEVMEEKSIMSIGTNEQLDNALSVWLEYLGNAAAVGLMVYGSIYAPKQGEFNKFLNYVILSCGTECVASVMNHISNMRYAEEILGHDLDTSKVPQSTAYRKATWGGGAVLAAGGLTLAFQLQKVDENPADHGAASTASYAGVFMLAAGMLSMLSLAPRIRGNDYIQHVIDELKLGDGTQRLRSFLLNCRPSRSDVDDFYSAGFMTGLMGLVANAVEMQSETGFLAAASCALAGYFLLKSEVHLFARSKANELLFWKAAPGRTPEERKAALNSAPVKPSAAEPSEGSDNCYNKTRGCLSRVGGKMYKWMTKTPWCGSVEEEVLSRKNTVKG